MAIVYNSSIVRDGLALHLDAANTKSYPGSGTSWYDLSKTRAVATAVNGPTFNTNRFLFDGSNDYFYLDDSLYYGGGSTLSEMSVFAWIITSSNSTGSTLGDNGANNGNWSILDFDRSEAFTFAINGTGEIQMAGDSSNYGGLDEFYDLIGTNKYNDGNWHYIGWTFSVANQKIVMYADGEVDRTFTGNGSMSALGAGVKRYGLIGDGSEAGSVNGGQNSIYYQGTIASIQFYNSKALTAAEVRQNFESMRGRYGI
jgi:hypothetical protein